MSKTIEKRTKTNVSNSLTLTDVLPRDVTYSKRGLPLRWRMAIYTSLAIVLLSIAGAIVAYIVVHTSLYSDLVENLQTDALKIKAIYEGKDQSKPVFTGGIVVQIYDQHGEFISSSQDVFKENIPSEEILKAFNQDVSAMPWQGTLGNIPTMAMLTPITNFGVVAVVRTTDYINTVLKHLTRSLIITILIFTLVSSFAGYFVAATSLKPVTELATTAARLDPKNLVTLPYIGPNDEIGQLHTVLDALIERLKEAMDAQKVFLAETSHELRTPLTSIKGFLERAQKKATEGSEIRGYIDDAVRISQSMTSLVSDILQLSRDEYIREYTLYLIDITHDLLEPTVKEFPGVQLQLTSDKSVLILGDADRLRQMLRNLVTNAIRACGDSNKVTLSFVEKSQYIVIKVKDKGPGIPSEVLPHIFNKFYKGKSGGAGLGLAIVKQIAEAHKGHVKVKSGLGKGTNFYVYLPVLEP